MGAIYVPKCQNQQAYVGNVSSALVTSSPLIFIKVDGIIYANGHRFNVSGGIRNLYGSYNSSNGNVYLNSFTYATTSTVPAVSYNNVEVLLISSSAPAPLGTPVITNITSRLDDGYYDSNIYVMHVQYARGYNIYSAPKNAAITNGNATWTFFYSTLSNNDPNYVSNFSAGTVIGFYLNQYVDQSVTRYKIAALGEENIEYGVGYYG